MTDPKVIKWRRGGAHLPDFMRDFHDQKDLFKTLHQSVNVEGHEYAKDIGWIAGQCYVIDIFLWWLARHGYVIRKSTAHLDFDSLDKTMSSAKEVRDNQSAQLLRESMASP